MTLIILYSKKTPILPSTKYYAMCDNNETLFKAVRFINYYDEHEVYIGNTYSISNWVNEFTTPDNAKFADISVYANSTNLIVVQYDYRDSVVPYGYKQLKNTIISENDIPKEYKPVDDNVLSSDVTWSSEKINEFEEKREVNFLNKYYKPSSNLWNPNLEVIGRFSEDGSVDVTKTGYVTSGFIELSNNDIGKYLICQINSNKILSINTRFYYSKDNPIPFPQGGQNGTSTTAGIIPDGAKYVRVSQAIIEKNNPHSLYYKVENSKIFVGTTTSGLVVLSISSLPVTETSKLFTLPSELTPSVGLIAYGIFKDSDGNREEIEITVGENGNVYTSKSPSKKFTKGHVTITYPIK